MLAGDEIPTATPIFAASNIANDVSEKLLHVAESWKSKMVIAKMEVYQLVNVIPKQFRWLVYVFGRRAMQSQLAIIMEFIVQLCKKTNQKISVLCIVAILDFSLPVWSYIILRIYNRLLDKKK